MFWGEGQATLMNNGQILLYNKGFILVALIWPNNQ
jgi:hypothetical protein